MPYRLTINQRNTVVKKSAAVRYEYCRTYNKPIPLDDAYGFTSSRVSSPTDLQIEKNFKNPDGAVIPRSELKLFAITAKGSQ